MAEATSNQRKKVMDSRLTEPPLQLPDAASIAENALIQALEFCAQKMDLDGHLAAADHVRRGNSTACTYHCYGIARRIAESLGTVDENVKAVYTLDYDATPQDLCFGKVTQGTSLIHLIVWTQRKTAAFDSLAAALDRALVQAYTDILGTHNLTTVLDVQVIDDADVEKRIGYGALLASIHHCPIQVWKR